MAAAQARRAHPARKRATERRPRGNSSSWPLPSAGAECKHSIIPLTEVTAAATAAAVTAAVTAIASAAVPAAVAVQVSDHDHGIL